MTQEQKKELIQIFEKFTDDKDQASELISYLMKEGVVSAIDMRKVLVKRAYLPTLRENDNRVRKTILDLSVRYGLSQSTIKSMIYDRKMF